MFPSFTHKTRAHFFKIEDGTFQATAFGDLNYQDCVDLQTNLQNKHTVLNEQKASNAFIAYLKEIGVKDTNFFTFTEAELDKHLSTFWFKARKKDGSHYTASSMETMRYGLSRALCRYGHNYDITKRESISFIKSIEDFEDSQKKRKHGGYGHVQSYKEIPSDGELYLKFSQNI